MERIRLYRDRGRSQEAGWHDPCTTLISHMPGYYGDFRHLNILWRYPGTPEG